jgi:quercetin dioxygenase-like cupin family protein
MDYRIEKWSDRVPPDTGELRRIMLAENYDVIIWSDGPGAVYGSYDHSEDQSHWIISGKLELTVEGIGSFLLGPGDRDFMPAGTRHSARVVGDEQVHYLIGVMR